MGRKVTKAIFPVAGLGTRFLPTTKSIPKEMLSLVDKPLIQYAIDEARAAGIKEFIFVTSRGKGSLEDYFDHAHELESSLKKAGKTELLEILRATNMDSGAIAYIRLVFFVSGCRFPRFISRTRRSDRPPSERRYSSSSLLSGHRQCRSSPAPAPCRTEKPSSPSRP